MFSYGISTVEAKQPVGHLRWTDTKVVVSVLL